MSNYSQCVIILETENYGRPVDSDNIDCNTPLEFYSKSANITIEIYKIISLTSSHPPNIPKIGDYIVMLLL